MDNSTRQAKRAPVTLKIKFKSETLAQFIERYAVDVSPGGIFIRTKDPLAVGTPMKFEFQLRDAAPLITGEGTVVWTRENDPARPNAAPGMGLRFDRLGEGSQTVLDKILAEKNKQATGTTSEAQPRMFGDAPTRVAPSPLVGQLIGESRSKLGEMAPPRTGFGDERTDTTPLPRPMPFHSDAEEFPDETFEEATKVRSVEDLIAATAHGGGLGGLGGLGGKPAPRTTLQMSTPPVPVPSQPMAPPLARMSPIPPPPAAHQTTPPPPTGHHATPPPPPGHARPPLQPPDDSLFGGSTVVAPPPIPTPAGPPPSEPPSDVVSADAVGAEIDAPARAGDAPAETAAAPATPAPRPTPPMPMAAVEPATESAAAEAKAPEAKAPEAKAPEAKAPEAKAKTPKAKAAEAKAKAAEAKAAEAKAKAAEAKAAEAAVKVKAADAGAEAKAADAGTAAKPAEPAAAGPSAEPLPVAPETPPAAGEPAVEPAAAAPIEAATPPREATPVPAPKAAPAPLAPARAPVEAKPPVRMRPSGVPIPPPELTDPNRRHFVDTSAAAQIETPPLFTPTMIILAIAFALALVGLVWFFFLRPSEPEDLPLTDPSGETATPPAKGSALASPSFVNELASAGESAHPWSS